MGKADGPALIGPSDSIISSFSSMDVLRGNPDPYVSNFTISPNFTILQLKCSG